MQITINGANELQADFREFPNTTQRAMVRALNRAIGSGNTLMVRLMSQDMGLKSGDVRKSLSKREASLARPEATLSASLQRLPLYRFNARQTTRGVSYRLPGGKGKVPGAFIATVANGHTGVFMRKGPKRLPIRQLYGPSLGGVFAKYREQGLEKMREAFLKNFDHELKFAQSGGGSGV